MMLYIFIYISQYIKQKTVIEKLLPWIPLRISHVEATYKSFFIIIIICTIFLTFKYLKRITSNVKQINNKKSCKNEYKKIQITFLKNTHSMINGVIFCGFLMWMIGSSLFIFILLLLCKVLLSTYIIKRRYAGSKRNSVYSIVRNALS